ncbi:TPA: carbohydrate binding domain-containing protein, partial [Klebsiella aerogenes]|nr:carbohydrate binding domain-containing protein [Klebsiella aerogenes]
LFANQKAPLPHNTPRRYQVIVKAKGVSGAMNFMVRRFNYLGNVAGTYENRQFSATDTWATYAAEFSAPSSATVDGSVFALYCYPNASVIQIDYIAIYDITDAVAIDANTSAVTQLQQTVTQQGQDIAANASATTAVSASLNAAMADVDNKITGNLILNGGFERDFTNWTAPAQATVMSAQNPHSGKKIVKYVAATNATLLSSDTVITAVKGRTYKFGAWLRAKAGSTMQPNTQPNNKVRFAYLDSSVIAEARFDPATMPTGSVWQEYSNTYTATKDGTMSVSINAFLNAGEIYIDDVYVIDITDRVDLDATAGAVSNLQSTVTQQGKDIASNASAITSVNASIGALQSQGLNPWCDGSFESYTANQQLGSTSLARVSTDVYRNGQKSLKITRNNGENGNSDKMIGNWLAVRGGGKYRFSLWAYMASDMSTPNAWNVSVGLFARGENGGANQWPEAVRISETNISRGKWVLLTGVATVGADRSIAQMWISTRGPNGGAGYSLYLDDISIVDVTDAQEAQDTATGAANAVTQLTATVTQQGKDITAQAGQITSLGSRVGDAESRITKQDETIASNGLAMATGFNQMRSMIGDNSAAITTTNKTVADLEKSTTEQIITLTSQVGDMSATVQQTASTVADLNGQLGAQWGLKVSTSSGGNNYVAGLQLGIDGSGQSQFLVQADTFGVYVPNGDQKNMVFGIDGNGAYFQQAMARNLVIDFAQISNNIQSTNYVEGVSGWAVNKNGGAQFNNAIFRGHVEASSGSFQGNINATSGSFRGTIDATDGIFRGTVQASRFIGDICSAGVFPEGKRPDITHYDSGNNGVPKTYAVSAVVACGVSFVGKIRVWIKGIKVSEIGVSGASDNASTRYIPVFGALSGVTDTNVRCEVTIEGSGIANYNGGFVIMTRSTGSWA